MKTASAYRRKLHVAMAWRSQRRRRVAGARHHRKENKAKKMSSGMAKGHQ